MNPQCHSSRDPRIHAYKMMAEAIATGRFLPVVRRLGSAGTLTTIASGRVDAGRAGIPLAGPPVGSPRLAGPRSSDISDRHQLGLFGLQ